MIDKNNPRYKRISNRKSPLEIEKEKLNRWWTYAINNGLAIDLRKNTK